MIALFTRPGCYASDSLVAVGGLPLASFDAASIGLPDYQCPYGLARSPSEEVAVVVSSWLLYAAAKLGVSVERVMDCVRGVFRKVVLIDHSDPFMLTFGDTVLSRADVVLKVNGIFNDLEAYNFVLGSPTPNGRWTEREMPRGWTYPGHSLQTIQLSIPCFFGVIPKVRSRVRKHYQRSSLRRLGTYWADTILARLARPMRPDRPPRHTVHFYVSLTHAQRRDALRVLHRRSIPFQGGITDVPYEVCGLGQVGIKVLSPDERTALLAQLLEEKIVAPRQNRLQYMVKMLDCKAVLSVAGYGELCFRMAEAWAGRRVLVCQDLSHVRTLFPLKAGRNVIYCRPDLSDLAEILDDIECNLGKYISVAEQGYRDWLDWCRGYREVLRKGFAPLYEWAQG
jgi:hypothetical protein